MAGCVFINGHSIIINDANKKKIENLLDDVQNRAQVRRFSIADIYGMPTKIEEYKNSHCITWADLEGCVFSFDTYQTMPNCYKYKISYTYVRIIIEKGKCRIENIARYSDGNKRTNAHRNHIAVLTDRAKQAILENAIYM